MKIKYNYHTHTSRCHHALGTDEEYVKAAIKHGITVLGFSDHTPYFFDGDFVSGAKMLPSESEDYFNTLLHLREKYKDKIEIKIGFETEYYPRFFARLAEEYKSYPLEYIILGQHFVGNEGTSDAVNVFHPTSNKELLVRFVDQCTEALNTELFTYFAHPDCLNYIPLTPEDSEAAEFEYERLIRAAVRTETPIEINLCGVRHKRQYPNPNFWRIAGKLGAKTVIGFDAHDPSHIAIKKEIKIAEKLIKDHSLNYIESFPLKKPYF